MSNDDSRLEADSQETSSQENGSGKKMFGHTRVINFMKYRTLATVFSVVLLLGSIGSLFVNGINFGLDFTGGTLVELSYEEAASVPEIRNQLEQLGHTDAVAQEFGSASDVLIRIPGAEADVNLGSRVAKQLDDLYDGDITVKRVEFVGPQVGEQLRDQGGLGMMLALALVMLYIAFRFQYKFSIGAVVALAHDAIVVLGLFSLLGLQFDLTVLAAILAVIGYSLNDTIIVYDRVRENFRKVRRGTPEDIINISLSQTLGRTLATSGTTMMVLFSLFFLGGETIHGFSTALLVGVGIGTYSSIYIASNMLLYLNVTREDLIPPPKEEDADEMP
ncbi:protein translocase subunit SecF [Parendozoicomonas haliclonae]|uniref:Protein-export membrane protein SecF n=1 Tax=Parendozoicomonas haliclonae TaxID=1960125 RepID=A0A1X7ADY5_9GAMM|nr:preprotein translocase subunit SecF [Parendozoicomonas haliclonae]